MPDVLSSAGTGAGIGTAIAPGIGTLVGGAIGLGVGLLQRHKGNKMLKNLQYPTETMPKEYLQNQQLAQQMAATGMPSEQYNQAMRNIQRQQLAAIRNAQDRRAGVGLIPYIQQNTNDATLNLDAQNAQQRIANQRNLMNVNSQVAGVKRSLFDLNTRQKYNRDYDYAMNLLGSGGQNLAGGLDKIAAGGLGLFGNGGGGGKSYGNPNFKIPIPNFPDIYPA